MGARARARAENPHLLCQLAPLTLSPEPDLACLRTSQPFIHTKPLIVPISVVCHNLVKKQFLKRRENDKVASDEFVHAPLSRSGLFSSTSGGCVFRDAHLPLKPRTTISPIITILSCKCIFSSHIRERRVQILNIKHVITFEEVMCANRWGFFVCFFSQLIKGNIKFCSFWLNICWIYILWEKRLKMLTIVGLFICSHAQTAQPFCSSSDAETVKLSLVFSAEPRL